MSLAKVLILYNEPVLPQDHPDAPSEHEILDTVAAITGYLESAGYAVTRLGASYDPDALLAGLRRERPDVVFNLFEGTGDHGQTEAYAAGLLHWLRLPFTGCPFETLCLARNKHLTKHLLRGAGLPTPEFLVVEGLPLPEVRLSWPVIVKPATQDASVGLDQGSVVTDRDALERRVAWMLQHYGPPVLLEEFIPGREFNVAVIDVPEPRALPISEITFVKKEGFWPIVTFDAKWKPGTDDYEATPTRYPAEVTPRLAERLNALALRAFRLLNCRDYARLDFRVRPNGVPYLLEVNPNPDYNPVAGFAHNLLLAGISHADFTVQMVEAALRRGGAGEAGPVPTARVEPVGANRD